jgi:hypothetical protein
MPEFIEGNLRFEFDERWTVQKYDGHRDYREKIERLEGTKAVDFVGLLDGNILYWIEVKDFRGHRIENRPRLAGGDLMIEVAQKVRDSIAGVVGAYRNSSEPVLWRPLAQALVSPRKRLKVLLWLEEDAPPRPRGREQNRAQVLGRLLKVRMAWLTGRVFVCGQRLGGHLEGCTMSNLPSGGHGD